MKIGKTTILKNGNVHEIEYGDIFSFDFESLKGSSFEGSNLGRSIYKENPDEVILTIGKGELGYFEGKVEYIKNNEVSDSFSFYEPIFMNYITGKKALSFLRNEDKKYEVKININFGDLYLMSFEKFKKIKYLKSEKLEELKLNNPKNILIHFFNMKEINEEMYPNCLTAKVYAFKEDGFVNFDTPEDIEEDKQYCIEENKIYNPDMHIVDYTFSGLSYNIVKYMKEQSMLNNKVGAGHNCENLNFESIKQIFAKNKKENKQKMKP